MGQLHPQGHQPAVGDGALQAGGVPAVLPALPHRGPLGVERGGGGSHQPVTSTVGTAMVYGHGVKPPVLLHLTKPPVSLQLGFDLDREVYPMVVQAVVDEGEGEEGLPCWVGLSRLLAP